MVSFIYLCTGDIVNQFKSVKSSGALHSNTTQRLRKQAPIASFYTHTPAFKAILESMYVDDLTKPVDSITEVHKIITGTPAVLQTGCFNLTKFAVNNEKIMSEIPKDQRAKEVHDFSGESVCRALVIKWHITNDVFFFVAHAAPDVGQGVTRRDML